MNIHEQPELTDEFHSLMTYLVNRTQGLDNAILNHSALSELREASESLCAQKPEWAEYVFTESQAEYFNRVIDLHDRIYPF